MPGFEQLAGFISLFESDLFLHVIGISRLV
jgi:hypothetical protein